MRRLFFILFILAALGAAFFWFSRPKPINVVLVEVGRGKVEASVANTRAGSVEACLRTRLSPIIGGRIVYLGIKKGDHVKKGQVLLRLWNEDQLAQSNLARSQVNSVSQRITEVCTLAENAEREAARMAKLRERGFISEGGEEKARFEAKSRRAACEAARADVTQAEARVNVTKAEQDRTVLVAPFDGIVADIVGELGEYTTPSPPGVATPPAIDLIDDSCLYIEAPMDEVDAPKIHVGQIARVTLDALPDKVILGHVRRVAPYVVAVEKQARTVDVEVDLESSADLKQLLVGYSADVEIVLASRDNVLRLPTSTLMEGNKVLVYLPAKKSLEERVIKVGVSNWEYTEIVDGLKHGDQVVASLEREGVKAGALVVPENEQSQRGQAASVKAK